MEEERVCFLCLIVFELGHWSSPVFGFGLGLELHHWLSWVCSLPTADLGTFQPPQLCEPIPHNKSLYLSSIYLYLPVSYYHSIYHLLIFTPLVLFLWRVHTNTHTDQNTAARISMTLHGAFLTHTSGTSGLTEESLLLQSRQHSLFVADLVFLQRFPSRALG